MNNQPSTTKPQEKKYDHQFYVFSGRPDSVKNFPYWLDGVEYRGFSNGWKDKHGKPGIALLNKDNKKVGVIICSNGDDKEAVQIIKDHMEDMGY